MRIVWLICLSFGLGGLGCACSAGEEAAEISGDAVAISDTELGLVVGCYKQLRVEVDEGPDRVKLRAFGKDWEGGDCGSTTTVSLDAPLADREVIDDRTGRTIEVVPIERADPP